MAMPPPCRSFRLAAMPPRAASPSRGWRAFSWIHRQRQEEAYECHSTGWFRQPFHSKESDETRASNNGRSYSGFPNGWLFRTPDFPHLYGVLGSCAQRSVRSGLATCVAGRPSPNRSTHGCRVPRMPRPRKTCGAGESRGAVEAKFRGTLATVQRSVGASHCSFAALAHNSRWAAQHFRFGHRQKSSNHTG